MDASFADEDEAEYRIHRNAGFELFSHFYGPQRKLARVSKVLHLKRAVLFPVLDSVVVGLYSPLLIDPHGRNCLGSRSSGISLDGTFSSPGMCRHSTGSACGFKSSRWLIPVTTTFCNLKTYGFSTLPRVGMREQVDQFRGWRSVRTWKVEYAS